MIYKEVFILYLFDTCISVMLICTFQMDVSKFQLPARHGLYMQSTHVNTMYGYSIIHSSKDQTKNILL